MQANSLSKITIVFGALIVALYVVFDLLTSGGNAVAQLYRYLLIGGAIYGLLSPRSGLYLLIFLTAYLDFTKRLMIFDTGFSKMDLYYVLGVSPALMCGIAAHVVYNLLVTGRETRPGLAKLAIVVVCIVGFFGAMGVLTSTNRFKAVGDSVNATVYLLLIPVIPMLFRTPDQLRNLLRITLIIYSPAIIYMLVHGFRGTILSMNIPIFDWELDYVKSGMTIEIRQLAERKFRPFGTFNSAANASIVFAAILGIVRSSLWKQPSLNHLPGDGRAFRFILAASALLAMYVTYNRTGWVFALLIVIVPMMFRNRVSTILIYALGAVATGLLIFSAPYLLKHKILNQISNELYSSTSRTDSMAQVTNIATMNDRLEGFENLVSSGKLWTPFGFKLANMESAIKSIFTHDAFSTALMKYGYVPLAISGIAALLLIRRMHAYVLLEKMPLAKYMASTCLGVGIVLCLGGLVTSAAFITYPINFWIWFMFSFVVALMFWRAENVLIPAEAREGVVRLPVRPLGSRLGLPSNRGTGQLHPTT